MRFREFLRISVNFSGIGSSDISHLKFHELSELLGCPMNFSKVPKLLKFHELVGCSRSLSIVT